MTDQPLAAESTDVAPLTVRAALRTDVGLVRSENQDFGTYTTADEERVSHAGGRLLLVADGMGGHRGGARASRLAAETVKSEYLSSAAGDVAAALLDSLTRANAAIYNESQANPDLRGMGTTTSALVIKDGQSFFGHVGDSRIYRVRRGNIQQLTEDHSLVASMVREGLLTSKEAEVHPRRNVLQRSMGVGEQVEIDVRGPFEVEEGDTYILCSDGLHGLVREDELRQVATLPIERAADEYVRLVLERGAPDNVTVIVARVERSKGEPAARRAHDALLLDETQRGDAFDDTERMAGRTLDATELMNRAARPAQKAAEPIPQTAAEVVSVPHGDVQIATRALDAEPNVAPPEESGGDISDTVTDPAFFAPTRGAAPENASSIAHAVPGATAIPFVKWIVIAALIAGAIAAWFAFAHRDGVAAAPPAHSSAR